MLVVRVSEVLVLLILTLPLNIDLVPRIIPYQPIEFIVGFLLIWALLHKGFKKQIGGSLSTSYVFVSVIIVHMMISSILSIYSSEAISGLLKFASGFGLFLLMTSYVDDDDLLNKLYCSLLMAGKIFIFIALFGLLIGVSELHLSGIKVMGLHSNSVGLLSSVILILFFGELIKKVDIIGVLFFFASIMVLVLSYNKTMMISVSFFILLQSVLLYRLSEKRNFLVFFYLAFLGLGAVFGSFLLKEFMPYRVNDFIMAINNPLEHKNLLARMYVWGQAVEYASESPFFGKGLYTSIYYLRDQYGLPMPHSHNFFYDLLLYLGFFGTILFLIWFASVFLFMFKSSFYDMGKAKIRHISLFLGAVVYFYASMMSGGFSTRTHFWFWIICSLAVASGKLVINKKLKLV